VSMALQGLMIVVDAVKKDFARFANSYADAVKNGARSVAPQLLEAVKADQSNDKLVAKLVTAIERGVQLAGGQLISSGAGDSSAEPAGNQRKKRKRKKK